MKVLIIDDSEGILRLLEIFFEKEYNAKVVTAVNGQDGIEKYDAGNFDLVVTDYYMPVKGGELVLSHIKNKTKTILMSGDLDISMTGLADFLCADACIKKPFDIVQLKELMKKLGF